MKLRNLVGHSIRVQRGGRPQMIDVGDCTEVELRAFCHEMGPDCVCDVLIDTIKALQWIGEKFELNVVKK